MSRRQNQLFTRGAKILVVFGGRSLYCVLFKLTLNNTNMQRNCLSSKTSKLSFIKGLQNQFSLLFCKNQKRSKRPVFFLSCILEQDANGIK